MNYLWFALLSRWSQSLWWSHPCSPILHHTSKVFLTDNSSSVVFHHKGLLASLHSEAIFQVLILPNSEPCDHFQRPVLNELYTRYLQQFTIKVFLWMVQILSTFHRLLHCYKFYQHFTDCYIVTNFINISQIVTLSCDKSTLRSFSPGRRQKKLCLYCGVDLSLYCNTL